MATDPSPTAVATRLTDPCRTSPAASTPGSLVSSGKRALGPAAHECRVETDVDVGGGLDVVDEVLSSSITSLDDDRQGMR